MKIGNKVKIAVCIPWSSPFIWSRFTEAALQVRTPEGTEVKWLFGHGWCPARRHADAIEKAIEWKADYLMIFGADQIAQPDLIERLYARIQQGYPVVCALVPSRGYFANNVGTKPFQPLAWRWKSTPLDKNGRPIRREYRNQTLDGDMLEVVKADGTIQPCHIIGSGCIVFHRDHILSLKRPWFQESIDPQSYRRFANMDTRFSSRLINEASATIWVDTSIKIGHLHDMLIDDTFQDRFDDLMDQSVKNNEPEIIQHEKVVSVK